MRVIEDGAVGGSLEGRGLPACYEGEMESILLDEATIDARLKELAAEVTAVLGPDEPLSLLCVLKGAFPTFTGLARHLYPLRSGPTFHHFLRLSSYVGDKSSGTVSVDTGAGALPDLANSHVLVVEDIVETGKTVECLQGLYSGPGKCKSFRVLSLLRKRTRNPAHNFQPHFVGFQIPDKFVIGFGLDYNEYYRELPFIGVISPKGIDNHKNGTASS